MEALLNNLIKAIGWSIIHSLWQAAIIYGLLFIVIMAWPKISARIKHNLSFGALCLMVVAFGLTFFSIFELPTTGEKINQIALSQVAYQHLNNFSNSFNIKTEAYFPIVAFVYFTGLSFQLIVLLSGYQRLKKLKLASKLPVPALWADIFNHTITQLKLNKTVQFYLSTKVNVPLVIGFFKPVVLFPVALATQLDPKQVEAILVHELSHIRRNDYLINLVKTCIETLLFFNPFVWLTTKFIHIEREHACDDLVVKITGTPLTYAHALLKLELLRDTQTPALSLAATGKNQHLYQRIKRITDMKTNYINAKQQFLILTLTIATVVSLAWINPKKSAQAKEKKTPIVTLIKPALPTISSHLTSKADTDTTKPKQKFKAVITTEKGKQQIYYSEDELPDSIKTKIAAMKAQFESPEWKEKMAKIQQNADEIAKKFQSKEWKENMAKIQQNADDMSKKFQTKEWKENMAQVEKNALEIAKKFQSKEWKEHMAQVEKNSLELQKKFESKEWKDQMVQVEKNALEMAKKFNSPEWKDQMAKIQERSLEIQKKFDSPEWKAQMDKIQKNSLELKKKFESPEWRQRVEELKKLQDSPEYKELRKKYEQDLEELKKKKGIKSDQSLMLFDYNTTDAKAFLSINPSNTAYASIPDVFALPALKVTLPKTNIYGLGAIQ